MRANGSLRALIRPVKRGLRRRFVRRVHRLRHGRWGAGGLPLVFGNAMPKSGSQMLAQLLRGLQRISLLVLVEDHPVRMITAEGRHRGLDEILSDLDRLQPGDIGWGYLHARAEFIERLTRPQVSTFFLYRDPRDLLLSRIFYATQMHEGHGLRAHFLALPDLEARILATIQGIPGELPGIADDYARYLDWIDTSGVFVVRFEDFIEHRQETLTRLLDNLELKGVRFLVEREQAIDLLNRSMDPARSPTYRAGKTGGWREHFTPASIARFKETAGELLIRLGYEQTMDW